MERGLHPQGAMHVVGEIAYRQNGHRHYLLIAVIDSNTTEMLSQTQFDVIAGAIKSCQVTAAHFIHRNVGVINKICIIVTI